jgi:hypothetical protein
MGKRTTPLKVRFLELLPHSNHGHCEKSNLPSEPTSVTNDIPDIPAAQKNFWRNGRAFVL